MSIIVICNRLRDDISYPFKHVNEKKNVRERRDKFFNIIIKCNGSIHCKCTTLVFKVVNESKVKY